jgi:hypothetical protein
MNKVLLEQTTNTLHPILAVSCSIMADLAGWALIFDVLTGKLLELWVIFQCWQWLLLFQEGNQFLNRL